MCLTLCDPMDCSLPVFSVHGILQARILEWVAMPSSKGFSQPRDQTDICYISCIGRQVPYYQPYLGSPTLWGSAIIRISQRKKELHSLNPWRTHHLVGGRFTNCNTYYIELNKYTRGFAKKSEMYYNWIIVYHDKTQFGGGNMFSKQFFQF